MSMETDERLEEYLSRQGIVWAVVPAARHFALENEWKAIYSDVWKLGMRYKQEARAQEEYTRHRADVFLIVPFLGDQAGPHSLGKGGTRTTAYECHGTGTLPDLSEFYS